MTKEESEQAVAMAIAFGDWLSKEKRVGDFMVGEPNVRGFTVYPTFTKFKTTKELFDHFINNVYKR